MRNVYLTVDLDETAVEALGQVAETRTRTEANRVDEGVELVVRAEVERAGEYGHLFNEVFGRRSVAVVQAPHAPLAEARARREEHQFVAVRLGEKRPELVSLEVAENDQLARTRRRRRRRWARVHNPARRGQVVVAEVGRLHGVAELIGDEDVRRPGVVLHTCGERRLRQRVAQRQQRRARTRHACAHEAAHGLVQHGLVGNGARRPIHLALVLLLHYTDMYLYIYSQQDKSLIILSRSFSLDLLCSPSISSSISSCKSCV